MSEQDNYHEFLIELEKQRAKTVVAGTIIPQLAGLASVIGGIVLMILGITGATSILVESGGFKANLLNASPGVILLGTGFLIIFVSIPKQCSFTRINRDGIDTGVYVVHGMSVDDPKKVPPPQAKRVKNASVTVCPNKVFRPSQAMRLENRGQTTLSSIFRADRGQETWSVPNCS